MSREYEQGWHRLRQSNSLGLGAAEMELSVVAEECGSPNWDGYGAAPVVNEAIVEAHRFLGALPLGVPAPSAGAEPDGNVTFEWYRSARRTLSVSVTTEGDLHYAALIGPSRAYGTEPFFGEIPRVIMELIRRVTAV
ncbi:MAG: hypothetical protein HY010_16655 [Acidobacteria bacterium]|nr:hypothetical protein [Acidobacteriota bacterium]